MSLFLHFYFVLSHMLLEFCEAVRTRGLDTKDCSDITNAFMRIRVYEAPSSSGQGLNCFVDGQAYLFLSHLSCCFCVHKRTDLFLPGCAKHRLECVSDRHILQQQQISQRIHSGSMRLLHDVSHPHTHTTCNRRAASD